MTKTKRPGTVWGLTVLTAIQALGGIPAGIGLVSDPINNIGMPLSILEGSPFKDFLIPGLILLVVLGLFPLVVLYGLVRRRRWGWWLSIAVGAGAGHLDRHGGRAARLPVGRGHRPADRLRAGGGGDPGAGACPSDAPFLPSGPLLPAAQRPRSSLGGLRALAPWRISLTSCLPAPEQS